VLETINYNKGVGSLIFSRKLKVRFTFVLWSTFEQTILKLDVCAFIISFRRFSNAKSTAENTYHDRVWLFFGSFRVFKYKLMYEHRCRQSLKLHMFFKIKYLLYKKKNIFVDGCARG